jgi:hypothetical protein
VLTTKKLHVWLNDMGHRILYIHDQSRGKESSCDRS